MFEHEVLDVVLFPYRTAHDAWKNVIVLPRVLLEGFEEKLARFCHRRPDNHTGYAVHFASHIHIGEKLHGRSLFFLFTDSCVRISDEFEKTYW